MGNPTIQKCNLISHFSHPHQLKLTTSSPESPLCAACKLSAGSGQIYSCKPCDFYLHESCSKMKQVITHPSHPSHTLTLLVSPLYDGGYFNCDGCGLIGTGFSYQCSLCEFDIHALCAYKPLSVIHKAHPQHRLELVFHSPYGADIGFSCDICRKIGKNQWLYRCIPCEFDAHVGCITRPRPHGDADESHHNALTCEPKKKYLPMVRPVGGPGMNNQNMYGQTGRSTSTVVHVPGSVHICVTTSSNPTHVPWPNGGANMGNGGPNGFNGGTNVLNRVGNTMMNQMARGLCQGYATNMPANGDMLGNDYVNSESVGEYDGGMFGSDSIGDYAGGLFGADSAGDYVGGLLGGDSAGDYVGGLLGAASAGDLVGGLLGAASAGDFVGGLLGGDSAGDFVGGDSFGDFGGDSFEF